MTATVLTGDCRVLLREQPATDPATIAYCAGVIDSDGTIGIRRITYAMRVTGDARQPVYAARICVRQVEPHAVTLLAETFGGSILQARTYAKRGRLLLQWEVCNLIAERALTALLPFLRIKRAQAENCLRLRALVAESKRMRVAFGRGHAGAAARPADITEAMEQAYLRAKQLNAVGTGERRLP